MLSTWWPTATVGPRADRGAPSPAPTRRGLDDRRVDDENDVCVAAERNRAALTEAAGLRQRPHPARKSRVARGALEHQLEARAEEARVRLAEREAVFSPPVEARQQAGTVTVERVAQHRRVELVVGAMLRGESAVIASVCEGGKR